MVFSVKCNCELLIKLLWSGYVDFFFILLVCLGFFIPFADIQDPLNSSVTIIINQLLFCVLALICSVRWDKSVTVTRLLELWSRLRHTRLVFSKCLVLTQDTELPSSGHWSVLLFLVMNYVSWADVLLAPALGGRWADSSLCADFSQI